YFRQNRGACARGPYIRRLLRFFRPSVPWRSPEPESVVGLGAEIGINQLGPQRLAAMLGDQDQPHAVAIIFLLDRAGIEAAPFLGDQAVVELTRRIGVLAAQGHGGILAHDLGPVLGKAGVDLLAVGIARRWVGEN